MKRSILYIKCIQIYFNSFSDAVTPTTHIIYLVPGDVNLFIAQISMPRNNYNGFFFEIN